MKKTKSIVVTIVIIIYLLGIVPRQVALAEELPPPDGQQQSADPSASPDPSPSPDPNAVQQNADPSPSPDPSPLPSETLVQEGDPCVSDCPPTEVDQTNDAAVDNQVTDVTDTGNNTIDAAEVLPEATQSASTESSTSGESPSTTLGTSEPTLEVSGDAQITTGDAATQVDMVNLANTNLVNSDINYHILNIFLDENGNIDLAKSEVSEVDPGASLVVNQQNTAAVNNTVLAVAESGDNTINGTVGQIVTGSADVVVNIVNFINANLINSHWDLVLINIFGHLSGDIILPEPQSTATLAQALLGEGDISQTNNATITNNVAASANSGNNSILGDGQIQTGDATSAVNLQTWANSNLIGGNYNWLLINNFGIWNGKFLGWGQSAAQDPAGGTMLFNFFDNDFSGFTCCVVSASQENNGVLTNQITAGANSGGNSLGNGGSIRTGNAFSLVNLFNFVNTNVIGNIGFFGIINIFGTLEGDIGGADHFAITEGTEVAQSTESQNQNQAEIRVAGGQLETQMSTNVGTHVNPGDTVMFFITAKNPGSGPVYDAKVTFNLYDSNGEIGTIQTFDLGKLNPGQRAYISFGVVLADTAPKGLYEALVEAQGKVGPDNQAIASQSQTSFQVGTGVFGSLISSSGTGDVQAASTVTAAAGPTQFAESNPAASSWWLLYTVLGYMGMIYFLYRISRRPYQLLIVYGKKKKIGQLIPLAASKLVQGAMAFKSWL